MKTNQKRENPEKEKSKENFCGACGAGLVALLGVGTATSGNVQNNRKMKKYVFWSGISITLISIFFLVYYLFFTDCGECA